jgi:hypothetical protein
MVLPSTVSHPVAEEKLSDVLGALVENKLWDELLRSVYAPQSETFHCLVEPPIVKSESIIEFEVVLSNTCENVAYELLLSCLARS